MDKSIKEISEAPNITLRDIARKLGIHHSTVGRALQNAQNISLARRTEIQEAARQLGYRPNAMATILGHQRHARGKRPISSEIAWINSWKEPKDLRKHLEFELYWKGANSRAEQNGYRLEAFVCGSNMSAARLEQILLARNIHGMLIPPHGAGKQLPAGWDGLDWKKFCVVRFGYSVSNPQTHLVASNQMTSGMIAIENMCRLGYKNIGFVAAAGRSFNFKAGFLIKQAELEKEMRFSIFNRLPDENQLSELRRFGAWLKKHKPDAILTDAAQTRKMLTTLGYRVPEDIGLAATSVLDGDSNAGIDQNSEAIGRAAIETLVSLLHHNEYGIPDVVREVLITGKWVNGTDLPQR